MVLCSRSFYVLISGESQHEFPIDILYNSEIEWHESFTVVLGPEDAVGADLGPNAITTVTILDDEVSGSLVLPAPPVVSIKMLQNFYSS